MWHKAHVLNAIADLLMLIGGAVLLAAAAIWLVRVPTLPIKQVVFAEPLSHTRKAEVEQLLPGALRGNFFSVNLDQVRSTLEQLPWVRKAEVRRVWPAKLEVFVEEHQPVARWGEGRGELVNSFGEVFSASYAQADSLPLMYGPQGTAPEVLRRFGEFETVLKKMAAQPVQLLLSSRLSWQVWLANGLMIDLGREQPKSPIDGRLSRFVEVFPGVIAEKNVQPQVVDLRYPNGFAMRAVSDAKGK